MVDGDPGDHMAHALERVEEGWGIEVDSVTIPSKFIFNIQHLQKRPPISTACKQQFLFVFVPGHITTENLAKDPVKDTSSSATPRY